MPLCLFFALAGCFSGGSDDEPGADTENDTTASDTDDDPATSGEVSTTAPTDSVTSGTDPSDESSGTSDDSDSDDSDSDDSDSDDSTGTMQPCEVANAPQGLTLSGEAFPRTTPEVSWSDPAAGCADTVRYEVAVGTSSGADDIVAFESVGTVVQWTGSLQSAMPDGAELFISVRAVDARDNVSDAVSASFEIWSPAQLPGLALWIDFSDGSTSFSNEGCSAPATSTAPIACQFDKSGNGNHMRVVDGTVAPQRRPNGIGDQATADFEGTCLLGAGDSESLEITTDSMTYAAVDRPFSIHASSPAEVRYTLQREGAYELAYLADQFSTAVETDAPGVWGWGWSGVEATAAAPQLNVFVHDAVQWEFRRDGVSLATIEPGAEQSGTIREGGPETFLGGRIFPGNTSFAYDGYMGEVVLTDTVLSESEMDALERYLMEKWRLE